MKTLRTFVFALAALVLGLVALVIGLWLCLRPSAAPAGQMIFGAFALAVTGMIATLIGALATRSSVEALAGGGGVKGAWKALTTEAKPEQPEPPRGYATLVQVVLLLAIGAGVWLYAAAHGAHP